MGKFNPPAAPFATGTCLHYVGGAVPGVLPPGGSMTLALSADVPTSPGNKRWLQIATADAVFPQVTISDPDNLTYAAIAGGTTVVGGHLAGTQLPAAKVVQSYQATCSASKAGIGPIVITFPNGATQPQVVLLEYKP